MVNTNNVCMFEGRVAKDPQFSQVNGQNGPIEKVTFDLAVDRGMSSNQRQNAQANQQPTADFIHCSMIGNQVNAFKQYCPKGKSIKVLCHYTQYSYTDKQTGQTQYGHQFDVDNFGFTVSDAKSLNNSGNNNNYTPNNNTSNNNNNTQPASNFDLFSNNPAAPF
jgi:single-strand DNA-binding protein